MKQRAIRIDPGFGGGDDLVFRNELEVAALAPSFEEIFERLPNHGFPRRARDLAQPVQLGKKSMDENLAHSESNHRGDGGFSIP
jgi:hypothetical protein